MSIVLFIVILLVLILVHEFGHFIVAKKAGIRVDEFGIGFPPRLLTFWRKGDTEYTLNWLPFGGFVKIFGENPSDDALHGKDKTRSFIHQPKHIQALVLLAGIIGNVLFAWALFSFMFMIGMPSILAPEEVAIASNVELVIADVLPDSPAARIGLMAGDTLLALESNNTLVDDLSPEAVSAFISKREGDTLLLTYRRNGVESTVSLVPTSGIIENEPTQVVVGIAMALVGTLRYAPPESLWKGVVFTYDITGLIGEGLIQFFIGIFTFSADFSQIAGPVGIVGLVGSAAENGLVPLLFFTAIISINLAIINLIPFLRLTVGDCYSWLSRYLKVPPLSLKLSRSRMRSDSRSSSFLCS